MKNGFFKLLPFTWLCLFPLVLSAKQRISLVSGHLRFPERALVRDSTGQRVNVARNQVQVKKLNDSLYQVSALIAPEGKSAIGAIDLPLTIEALGPEAVEQLKKQFHWLPNLKSSPEQVVGQHVFRSPCIIQTLGDCSVVLIPDLELLASNTVAPYYLDLSYEANRVVLHYGIKPTQPTGHIYYEPSGASFGLDKPLRMGFYLLIQKTTDPLKVLDATNAFLWKNLGSRYTSSVLPQTVPFARYAEVGYGMALDHYWVNTKYSTGGITLSTLSNADGRKRGRYFQDDLWFQSWFNNLRTAYGLYSWGTQLQNNDWQERALKTVTLFMNAPDNQGWFPTVYAPKQDKWLASGSPGFAQNHSYYVPDNCWAAYWLLRFSIDMQDIPGADQRLLSLAENLLKLQHSDGSFPAGVRADGLTADTTLDHSASSAMATWYLEELLLAGKVPTDRINQYQAAIERSLLFLQTAVLPEQRFEDFENYYSCSPKPVGYYDQATAMYSQNTLSIQWCAEAFLKGFKLFETQADLQNGEYCLNILSLYQQVWNPPFISLYAFGGFGAQNSDGEWNDAREAQFAETYLDYYKATKKQEYLERAVYACRASFALMTLPENKDVCPNNYMGSAYTGIWPGTMAENYAHHGFDRVSGQSGFHWGTGSALTTAAIFKKQLGDLYLDPERKLALGINGVVVESAHWGKIPKIVALKLEGRADRALELELAGPAPPGQKIILNGIKVALSGNLQSKE